MKLRRALKHACLLAGLPLLLAGCAATATMPAGDPPAQAAPAQDTASLTRYHWQLRTATDRGGQRIASLFARENKPLQLDFQNDRIHVSHACNGMGGTYTVHGGKLEVNALISTMMACMDPAVNGLDHAIRSRLKQPVGLRLSAGNGQPTLTLTTPDGDTLVFVGIPAGTDAAR